MIQDKHFACMGQEMKRTLPSLLARTSLGHEAGDEEQRQVWEQKKNQGLNSEVWEQKSGEVCEGQISGVSGQI